MSASPFGARLRRSSLPWVLLIGAMLASAALLIALQSHLTFFLDDWDLLLHRRGFSADVFLQPHNEHIVIVPTIIYKTLQATFGMGSAGPYQVVSIATFVASAALLFVWIRRRSSVWLALLSAVLILFLGSAWEDLVSAFQVGFFGSMAFGLAALLALESKSRRGDVLACLALVVCASFSSLGLSFVAAAGVAIAIGDEARKRAWVAVIPAALFALWWIGWGRHADTSITFESVAGAPAYVLAGLASGISALLGLAPASGAIESGPLDWGRPLIFAGLAVAFWCVHSMRATDRRRLLPVVTLALVFWVLAAVNAGYLRSPLAPRYTYISAVFILMFVAELTRGHRCSARALAAVAAVVAVSIAVNLVNLRDGYRAFESVNANERGGLTGLEFARDTVAPDFQLTPRNSDAEYFHSVDAASYLSAIDAFGSPGLTEQGLVAEPEPVRVAADKAVAAAERLSLTAAATPAGNLACAPVTADADARTLELGPGTVTLRAGPQGPVEVRARRFATESSPVDLGRIGASESAILALPADRARTPWTLGFEGDGSAAVCRG
jgi:hypothetical protein